MRIIGTCRLGVRHIAQLSQRGTLRADFTDEKSGIFIGANLPEGLRKTEQC
jgi:hypothetical protein